MNYKMIKNILGWILLFEAIFMLIPLITAIIYGEDESLIFIVVMLMCIGCGGFLIMDKPSDTTLYSRDGFVIVSLSWIILSLFGALPFTMSGAIPSFVDALFETVSGFTTTGASILSDVESLPRSILMWRSFTHWVGGMGVLVFIMAFVQLSGGQNMHIMKAESPGPSVSKLVPRVRTTVAILYAMYFVLTILEFVILLFGGMTVFDALNTAFATAGTGGFGIKNDSFASYSPFLQIIVTVFMILFSVNFSSYYLIMKGKLKDAFNTELKVFLVVVAIAICVISIDIRGLFSSRGETVRQASFTVASIVSTTGFATADFDLWPSFSKTVILMLMFMGACAGSTGGGIKVSRFVIMFKGMGNEITKLIHPNRVNKIKMDSRPMDTASVSSVFVYMICFVMVFACSLLALSLFDNKDLVTTFSSVTSAMNNIGPGLNLTGPTQNFGFFSVGSKLVLIFDMLAGRLELFPMLLLFTAKTWKK